MGVNLSVVKLLHKELEETWGNKEEWYYVTEDQEWFDHIRHSGDRDFAVQILYNASDELDVDSGLYRPKDLDKTILWIEDKIETQGNRRRLIEATNKLKEDKNLYFEISW